MLDPDKAEPRLAEHPVLFAQAAGAGEPLLLRVESAACCAGGSYRSKLALLAREGTPEPLVVWLDLQVEDAGLLACWWPFIRNALFVLTVLLAAAYVVNMFRKSTFLDTQRLAAKLVPLRWDAYGSHESAPAQPLVAGALRRQLSPARRILNWIRANPLRFGLPGQPPFKEAARLELLPKSELHNAVVATLLPELDMNRRLRDDKRWGGRGVLLAVAKHSVLGRVGADHRVCSSLVPEERVSELLRPPRTRDDDEPASGLLSAGKTALVRPLERRERVEGEAAGWLVG